MAKPMFPGSLLLIGSPGSGKTLLLKYFIGALLYGNEKRRVVVIDVDGDYRALKGHPNMEVVDARGTTVEETCEIVCNALNRLANSDVVVILDEAWTAMKHCPEAVRTLALKKRILAATQRLDDVPDDLRRSFGAIMEVKPLVLRARRLQK